MARQMKDSGIEWIGEIPESWEAKKLKFVSSFLQKKYDESYGDLPYIGLENIVSWNGSYVQTDSQYDRDQSLICEPNDILFGKLRPYLAKVYLNYALQCCSGEFAVIRINEQHTRYMWYQMLSHGFIFTVDRSTYGTKMPRANADFIKNIPVTVPPLTEQHRIADILDSKCAEIDAVIERTKTTIEEYKKLKQAVITEAVTKGMRGPRPMKDSGIEWIGEIPEEWRLAKMHHVCATITDYVASGSFASLAENVVYLDEPDYAMLVRTMDVSGKGYSGKPVYINQHAYEFLSNSNLFGGEIMLPNIGASVGDVYIVPKLYEHMSLAPNSIMLRTNINDKFVYYYFMSNSGRRSVLNIAESTAQPKFNKTDFRQLRIPLPCDEEQDEIVVYLDEKCSALDTLIAKKTALLTELETYKKSLIYEYVTGKKEVL